MKKIINEELSMMKYLTGYNRGVVISEQTEVSDVERKQLSDKMIKDIVDKYYLDDVVNPTTKVPYQPFNNGGKLDYNKAYRSNMESIDQMLSELGFPNGVHIPENISRQEFDALKVKWNQSSSKLTESDLTRIVRRVINEEMFENTLYGDIMGIIHNSNSSHEETLSILRSIADEMKSSRGVRRNTEKRFRGDMNNY